MTSGSRPPAAADSFDAWRERCDQQRSGPHDDVARSSGVLARLVTGLPRNLDDTQRCIARRLLDEEWTRLMDAVLPSSAESGRHPIDPRVAKAIVEIDRRFADPAFRLRTLARQLAISDSRLTQLLKHATGHTFGRRLHARRIDEARALLADSALSVKEIASRVGYATTSQLDRHFRRSVGQLPSVFRAGARASARPTHLPTQQQK